MACPAGCLNGGGQLKSSSLKPRELSSVLFRKLTDQKINTFLDPSIAISLKNKATLDFSMNFKKVS